MLNTLPYHDVKQSAGRQLQASDWLLVTLSLTLEIEGQSMEILNLRLPYFYGEFN